MNYKNNVKRLELEEKENFIRESFKNIENEFIPREKKKFDLGNFLRQRKNKKNKDFALENGIKPYILSEKQKLKDEEKIIKNRERRDKKYGFKVSIKEALKLTYQMFLFESKKNNKKAIKP